MKLKELRKAAGLNQQQLAEKLGFKQATISQWEIGRRTIDSETLVKLADFYGVSTDYILGRPETDTPATDPLQNRLLKLFNNLNDFGKREAVNRVSELAQLQKYVSDQMPIAAHNERDITDKELELMKQDIDDL